MSLERLESCPVCKKSDQLQTNHIATPISALIVGCTALPFTYLITLIMKQLSIRSTSPFYALLIIGMVLALLSLLKLLPKKYHYIHCKRCAKTTFPEGITEKTERRDRFLTILIIATGAGVLFGVDYLVF